MTVKANAGKKKSASRKRSAKASPQKAEFSEGGKVFYSVTPKINTGNYENVAISVGLSLPCTAEDFETKFKEVQTWVRAKVAEELKEVSSGRS